MSGSISTRVPKEIEGELEEFMRAEKLGKSPAVRKLLRAGLEEWRKKRALELLERGEVTFNEAAEIAGLNVWSFADVVRRADVSWIKSVEKIRSDMEAAEQ